MMGLAYFQATTGNAGIDYEWQFDVASNQVNILSSGTPSGSTGPLI